jgi:ADP-heptose:LPS heptosyltransferase/glycosyltransferase involved in cell wall biosynthesis
MSKVKSRGINTINVLIEQNMGLGDIVFLEPSLRLLLQEKSVNKIVIMLPNSYKDLLADYNERITIVGIGDISKYTKQGYIHIKLTAQSHYDMGDMQRYKAFVHIIYNTINQSRRRDINMDKVTLMNTQSVKVLSVKGITLNPNTLVDVDIHMLNHEGIKQWIKLGEVKIVGDYPLNIPNDNDIPSPQLELNPCDRVMWQRKVKHPSLLYQINSFRKEKDIPSDVAINEIKEYIKNGYQVWVIANDTRNIPKECIWVRGFSIQQLKALCGMVDKYIGPDSGPSWLSASLGTSGKVYFEATDPDLYIPDNSTVTLPSQQIDIDVNKVYYYTPSKPPIQNKQYYKLQIIIPHLYLGGGETHLLYLLDTIPIPKEYIQIVVVGQVDTTIYPLLKQRYDIVNLDKADSIYLRKAIIDYNPDIILHHGTELLGNALENIQQKPVVIQIMHSWGAHWAMNPLESCHLYNDHVIAVADWIKEKFGEQYDIPVTAVLNGVSSIADMKATNMQAFYNTQSYIDIRRKYNIPKSAFVVGIMCRLSNEKGIDNLIEAFRALPTNVYLLMAGWGDSIEIPSDCNIKFIGMITNHPSFYGDVDCCILPSVSEGNSLFLLEAVMNKKPIITTNVGAVPELFKDKESCIVIENNPESIRAGILSILEKDIRDKLSTNAHNIIRDKCTSTIMGRGYHDIILAEIDRRINPKTILCTRDEGLGDILMTTPAIRALRRKYPNAEITYKTYKRNSNILEGNPNIDKIVAMDGEYDKRIGQQNYDVVINFEHNTVWDTGQHIIDYYMNLVGYPNDDKSMDIYPMEHELSVQKPYVVLCPKTNHWAKDWGSKVRWNKIAGYLHTYGYNTVIMDDYIPNHTIREMAYLFEQSEFIIGLESFSNHLGKVLNKKGIIIWGGATTHSIAWYDNFINILPKDDCRCQRTMGSKEPCPYNLRCLKSITLNDIYQAIMSLL